MRGPWILIVWSVWFVWYVWSVWSVLGKEIALYLKWIDTSIDEAVWL